MEYGNYDVSFARYYISENSRDFSVVGDVLGEISEQVEDGAVYSDNPSYYSFLDMVLDSDTYTDSDRQLARDLYNSGWSIWITGIYFYKDIIVEVAFSYRPSIDGYYTQQGCSGYTPIADFLHKYNPVELLLKGNVYDLSIETYWDCLSKGYGFRNDGNILARGGCTPVSCRYNYAIHGFFKYSERVEQGTGDDRDSYLRDIYLKVFWNSKYDNERWGESVDYDYCTYYLTDSKAEMLFRDILCSELLKGEYRLDAQTVRGLTVFEMFQYLENAINSYGEDDAFGLTLYRFRK